MNRKREAKKKMKWKESKSEEKRKKNIMELCNGEVGWLAAHSAYFSGFRSLSTQKREKWSVIGYTKT